MLCNFRLCLIGKHSINIYKSAKNVSFNPIYYDVVIDGTFESTENFVTIKGKKVRYHFHLNKTYVKDLKYKPAEHEIRYTWLRKKPYVRGCVEDSIRENFERDFINFKIEIE